MNEGIGKPALQWVITLDPGTGRQNVNGPITDEILTLGVLEKAKLLVVQHNAQLRQEQKIVPVRLVPNGNRGA